MQPLQQDKDWLYMAVSLSGFMGSFGTPSRRDRHRRTARHPGKSVMTGIICNAMGCERGDIDAIKEVSSLRMTSYALKTEGAFVDFQTAPRNVHRPYSKVINGCVQAGKKDEDHILMYRHYLSGFKFVVVMEGPRDLVLKCHQALEYPARELFIGRKCCLPTEPILSDVFGTEEEADQEVTRIAAESCGLPLLDVSCQRDSDIGDATDVLMDQPVKFGDPSVKYLRRFIRDFRVDIGVPEEE